MTDLCVIIVNYNTNDYLKQCIESIYLNTKKIAFEIIVVDNNSSDGSVKMLEDEFPDVKVIANQENYGFAKANNQALLVSQSRYAMLLNSDTVVKPSAFDILTKFMDEHQDVGIVGSRTFYPDNTVQGTARSFPSPMNTFFGRKTFLTRILPNNRFSQKYLTCLREDYTEPFEVDWVAGSCLMTRREVIDAIGMLDEGFWMYWEDADWCYRAKENGWKVFCVTDAQIIHFEGKSSKQQNIKLIREFHKSVYRYYRKHYIKSALNPMNLVAIVGLSLRCFLQASAAFLRKTS